MSPYVIRPVGEDALLIELGSVVCEETHGAVLDLDSALHAAGIAAIFDKFRGVAASLRAINVSAQHG